MEYKQFIVKAFEREPGKWRASVWRANGKAITVTTDHRPKLAKFVTGMDAKTAQAAMLMALAAVDAGAFSRHLEAGGDAMRALRGSAKVRGERRSQPRAVCS